MENKRVVFCIIAAICVIAVGLVAAVPHAVSAEAPQKLVITASSNAGGKISPSGKVTVNKGTSKTFRFIPSGNNRIADVKVDGKSIGAKSSYTFKNITKNHTIVVRFMSGGVLPWQQANPYLPW